MIQKIECPIVIKWEISEKRLRALRHPNKNLTTEWFEASNIPGMKYYLMIDLGGTAGKEQTGIYLIISPGKEAKVHADFILSIESTGWSKKLVRDFEQHQGWGGTFCEPYQFFGPPYIVDEKIIIKCEGILSVERTLNLVTDEIQQENECGFGNFLGENVKYFNFNIDGNILRVSIC